MLFRVEDRQGRGDIWMHDLARRVSSRFTFDPANDFAPIWSPDDTRVVFSSNRNSGGDLYVKASSGAGSEERVFASPDRKTVTQWPSDGRLLFGVFAAAMTSIDMWSLSLPDGKATPVLQTEFTEGGGQLSPDGRWLAYHSNESGRMEVYVQPFPGPGAKWKVSRDGGQYSRWRGTGRRCSSSLATARSWRPTSSAERRSRRGIPSHSSPFVRARGRSITRTTSLRTANGSS